MSVFIDKTGASDEEWRKRSAIFSPDAICEEAWPANDEAKNVMELVCDTFTSRGDSEAAHAAEDEAHELALAYIREGRGDAAQLASIALLTYSIKFDRWYA